MPSEPTPRDDFRVQTFEMPDGRILMRLTGTKSGTMVEAEHGATGIATLISLARLWLRAGGDPPHAIRRWLQFTEILFSGSSAPSLTTAPTEPRCENPRQDGICGGGAVHGAAPTDNT